MPLRGPPGEQRQESSDLTDVLGAELLPVELQDPNFTVCPFAGRPWLAELDQRLAGEVLVKRTSEKLCEREALGIGVPVSLREHHAECPIGLVDVAVGNSGYATSNLPDHWNVPFRGPGYLYLYLERVENCIPLSDLERSSQDWSAASLRKPQPRLSSQGFA